MESGWRQPCRTPALQFERGTLKVMPTDKSKGVADNDRNEEGNPRGAVVVPDPKGLDRPSIKIDTVGDVWKSLHPVQCASGNFRAIKQQIAAKDNESKFEHAGAEK